MMLSPSEGERAKIALQHLKDTGRRFTYDKYGFKDTPCGMADHIATRKSTGHIVVIELLIGPIVNYVIHPSLW